MNIEASLRLSRSQLTRLREFRRFSDGGQGLGLFLKSALDEQLVELGMLCRSKYVQTWVISSKGNDVLAEREKLEASWRKPHNDLSVRVGRWLARQGRLVWLNRSFRTPEGSHYSAAKRLGFLDQATTGLTDLVFATGYATRPDVISILPAQRRADYQPWIFEVKVSRQDFILDVKQPQKRLAYALLAERVYYVCPTNMIQPEEVPVGCSLVVEKRLGVFDVLSEPPTRKVKHYAHINRLLREQAR